MPVICDNNDCLKVLLIYVNSMTVAGDNPAYLL